MASKVIKNEMVNALKELALEEQEKAERSLTPEQREISVLAAKLIDLSRDMRQPGAALSEATRVERLIRTIKGE